ncbi:MAG: ricin-type beta-trefoil lectin domain protein [Austwickia sp.]|jgi:hypothetical protein|nr:ricin-type beta-trefoil lectin domain protein [Austwickia sp.]MBK9102353.1 ricin-type beta-trefoil lectin domain protein [Austwickia sp.]
MLRRLTAALSTLSVTASVAALAVVSAATSSATTAAAPAAAPPTPVILVNTLNDRCADIVGLRLGKVGDRVEQWYCRPGSYDNQQFLMWKTGTVGTAQRFMLQHGKGGLCVDARGSGRVAPGAALRLARCRSTDNQHFLAVPVKGGNGSMFLVHEASKLCIDVTGTKSKAVRRALVLSRCNAKDDHLWKIVAPSAAPVHPDPRAPKPVAPKPVVPAPAPAA